MDPLLKELLEIPTESYECERMWQFLSDYAEKRGWSWYTDKEHNLYFRKGDPSNGPFPCIVAHMDTVHRIEQGGIRAVEIDGKVTGINPLTMEQTGIGGDDKCGIYAALHCMEHLEFCKAAFFVDEEVGCIGSGLADMKFFSDCRYVLQADRRGYGDFVTDISGPLSSKAFQKALQPLLQGYGYSPCHGVMSDVMALRDGGVGISVANFSAAYYEPHSPQEWIDLEKLNKVCYMFLEICQKVTKRYPFQAPPKRNYYGLRNKAFPDKKPKAFTKNQSWFEDDELWEKYMERQAKDIREGNIDPGGKFPDYEGGIGSQPVDEDDAVWFSETPSWTAADERALRIMRE